ncbi:hypothetical protein CCACVL1_04315 [Corchorus capsularis]|uniref:Uncharacterized protein n=1 Tax=Corchorus capsularis TaxID=210143 RepID=A0A1R3JTI1_COCAP|nr:hypothetical protein CCACVL1_04315 [Corchorus capsularis]
MALPYTMKEASNLRSQPPDQ